MIVLFAADRLYLRKDFMVQSRDKLVPLRFHSGVPALDVAADVVVIVQSHVEAVVQMYAVAVVLHSV